MVVLPAVTVRRMGVCHCCCKNWTPFGVLFFWYGVYTCKKVTNKFAEGRPKQTFGATILGWKFVGKANHAETQTLELRVKPQAFASWWESGQMPVVFNQQGWFKLVSGVRNPFLLC